MNARWSLAVRLLPLIALSFGTTTGVLAAEPAESDEKAAAEAKAKVEDVKKQEALDRRECIGDHGSTNEATLDKSLQSLSDFSASTTQGATLASTTIARGYVTTHYRRKDNPCGVTAALGIDLSATAAANTADFSEYAQEELLGRRSGLINLYFNPFGGRDKNNPIYSWSDRAIARDRIYISGFWPPRTVDGDRKNRLRTANKDEGPLPGDRALSFVSFGVGGRGVKTAQDSNKIAPIGTMYLGLGFDGAFHNETSGKELADSGGLSLELFGTMNFANRDTLRTMTGVDHIGRTYSTVGASFKFWLSGQFYLGVDYDKAVGGGHRAIGESTLLRFGYAKPQAEKKPAGDGDQ